VKSLKRNQKSGGGGLKSIKRRKKKKWREEGGLARTIAVEHSGRRNNVALGYAQERSGKYEQRKRRGEVLRSPRTKRGVAGRKREEVVSS